MYKPLRALILCYDFPPFSSVGAQRPFTWFKYFHLSEVSPVVVTRHWDNVSGDSKTYIKSSTKRTIEKEVVSEGTIIYVPYTSNLRDKILLNYSSNPLARLVSKFLTLYLSIARFFTFSADNTANIYSEAEKIMEAEKFDIIIATGEPFFVFRYASKLSKKFNVPWIADYRDGWSSNIGKNKFSFVKKMIDKYVFEPIEKHIVSSAIRITTVVISLKEELQEIMPSSKIDIIPNGYNPEEFIGVDSIQQKTECFEIAYAGIVYPYHPVEIFLEGYRQFIKESGCLNTRAVFYGLDFYEENKNRVLNFDPSLNKHIVTTQRIPRTEIFKKLSEAHLLLLLANNSIDGSCTKIFEYLRLNRKILLVLNEHRTLNKLMDECKGGIKCENVLDVINGLTKSYEEFKQTKQVQHQSVNYEQFSRIKQAELFTKTIRECVV